MISELKFARKSVSFVLSKISLLIHVGLGFSFSSELTEDAVCIFSTIPTGMAWCQRLLSPETEHDYE